MIDTADGKVRKFKCTADIVNGDSVHKHFVEIRIPPTDKNGRYAASLAGLNDLGPKDRAEHL